ncbi:hypothetical protein CHT98_04670 [Azospirillum brasilense]|uniref:DUF6460 domain-containing protein n=1 Tax=Azospirillum brasilense TaxID=192 RepID=A0A235HI29_AZOBR|nr:DUF6460 domain-containing protein [Azospirillum tabaci]OYD85346.1 hypothetical protein CHT98_04670 [Azospirillum brasilense]
MVGWVVKTLLLCFVVGLVLSFLNINPANILTNSWDTVQDIARLAADLFHWALPYILIGAVIVVPLSVIGAVMRWTRTRHRP